MEDNQRWTLRYKFQAVFPGDIVCRNLNRHCSLICILHQIYHQQQWRSSWMEEDQTEDICRTNSGYETRVLKKIPFFFIFKLNLCDLPTQKGVVGGQLGHGPLNPTLKSKQRFSKTKSYLENDFKPEHIDFLVHPFFPFPVHVYS